MTENDLLLLIIPNDVVLKHWLIYQQSLCQIRIVKTTICYN